MFLDVAKKIHCFFSKYLAKINCSDSNCFALLLLYHLKVYDIMRRAGAKFFSAFGYGQQIDCCLYRNILLDDYTVRVLCIKFPQFCSYVICSITKILHCGQQLCNITIFMQLIYVRVIKNIDEINIMIFFYFYKLTDLEILDETHLVYH